MRPFMDDLHFGLRLLWRHPSFSILALLTLALGIGANTAVFSLVRGILLKPLPYWQPEQLYRVGGTEGSLDKEKACVSIREVRDVREQSRTLQAVAAHSFFAIKFVMNESTEPQQIWGRPVTANFFDVMGVAPALGRTFRSGEDQRGGPKVVILSYALWARNYASTPNVVGRDISLNGVSHEIVGVMPERFQYPADAAVWLPLTANVNIQERREYRSAILIARAVNGVAPSLVYDELRAIGARLRAEFPA